MKPLIFMWLTFLAFPPVSWGTDAGKDSYFKKTEKEVQEWGAKVESLQRRSEKAGVKTRAEVDRHVKVVQEKFEVVRHKATELEGSSEDTWKKVRRSVDQAMRDLKKTYRNATSFLDKHEGSAK